MKMSMKSNCRRAVPLLLCLSLILSCTSLKRLEGNGLEHTLSLLQLAVNESDFAVIIQRIQAMELFVVDFRPAITNLSGGDQNEFWYTFSFDNEAELMRNYVNLISNGFVRRISYPYQ